MFKTIQKAFNLILRLSVEFNHDKIFSQSSLCNIHSIQSPKYLFSPVSEIFMNPISEIFCSIQSPKYLLNPITDRNINAIQKRKHV